MSSRSPRIVGLSAWGLPFLVDGIATLTRADIELDAIVCARMDPALLGVAEKRSGSFFREHSIYDPDLPKIPFYFVSSHNKAVPLIRELAPDLLLNLGTPNILKAELLAVPTIGVLNSHPGLLPNYRGCSCVEWAIYNREPVGATCHFITQGIDEGPIVFAEAMRVEKFAQYERVRADMYQHQCDVMVKGIQRLTEEGLTFGDLPQQGEGRYYKPMPGEKLALVRQSLAEGAYECAAGAWT